MVLGHGILGDHRLFAPQIEALARQYRVLAIDFRGHGRSAAPEGAWDIADFSDDIRRVLDRRGVDRAVVGGLSTGAMAALRLALDEPDRVRGLVLIGATAGAERRCRRLKYEAMLALYGWVGASPWLRRRVSELAFSPGFRMRSQELVGRWADSAAELPLGTARRSVRAVLNRSPLWDRLADIRIPALVIAGTDDVATPLTEARRLADRLPHARLEAVEGAGHVVTLERPGEVCRLLLGFLAELDGEDGRKTG